MDEYIGDREEGFLFETDNGKMLSPETLFRDGFKTIFNGFRGGSAARQLYLHESNRGPISCR
jgi:hypothetical protein